MGLFSFFLILICLPILIGLLVVNIFAAAIWLIRGVLGLLLWLLKPLKFFIYGVLAIAGFAWFVND